MSHPRDLPPIQIVRGYLRVLEPKHHDYTADDYSKLYAKRIKLTHKPKNNNNNVLTSIRS
jgi:hypothetical protein